MYRKFSPNFKVVILSVLIAPMTAQAGHDASGDHYSPFIVKDTAQQVYWVLKLLKLGIPLQLQRVKAINGILEEKKLQMLPHRYILQ